MYMCVFVYGLNVSSLNYATLVWDLSTSMDII